MPNYTVSVVFAEQEFDTPLGAAKDVAHYLSRHSFLPLYDVVDEDTGQKFRIDVDKKL
jgi:hypothetical protein